MWIKPCECGKESLAQTTGHICPACYDDYQYCIDCLLITEEEEQTAP